MRPFWAQVHCRKVPLLTATEPGPSKRGQKNWAEVGGRRGETPQPSMPPVVRNPIGSGILSFQLSNIPQEFAKSIPLSEKCKFLLPALLRREIPAPTRAPRKKGVDITHPNCLIQRAGQPLSLRFNHHHDVDHRRPVHQIFLSPERSADRLVLCSATFAHGVLALRRPPARIEKQGERIEALVVGLLPLAALLGIIPLRYL